MEPSPVTPKWQWALGGFLLLVLIGTGVMLLVKKFSVPYVQRPPFTAAPTPELNSEILTSPAANSIVESPLIVTGSAPSGWMFEGQLGIKLFDSEHNLITQTGGQEVVPGSWQSDQPVTFTGTLTFTTTDKSGFLVIEADNPSGLPENSKSYEIPIHFN